MTERLADFAVNYQSYSAPLPPPHASSHSIWIGPGREGVVEMVPGQRAPGVPVWTERFPLNDTHLDWLFQVMDDQGLFQGEWRARTDVPVGGGSERLAVVADTRTIVIPPFVTPDREAAAAAMCGATRALVPQPVWDGLNARRAAHVAQFTFRPVGPGAFPDPLGQLARGPLFDHISVFIATMLGGSIGGSVSSGVLR